MDAASLRLRAPREGTRLRWSAAWVMESSAAQLVLSAGPDRRVAIDGLDAASRAAVERWYAGDEVAPRDGIQHELRDRLVALGALVASAPSWKVALLGDAAATEELAALLGDTATARHTPQPDELIVAVRTGSTWPPVPEGHLHMGLDLALHHTIVLGPLVLPGASACLDCLDARMAHQWPASPAPARPAVQGCTAVAAALLRVQVELLAGGSSPLVNATIAWDLERGITDRQALYKRAGCPRCDIAGTNGRVALPWEMRR